MNCSQARALLALYQELKNNPTDTIELEDHLAHCDACKDAYAQNQFIGERIRSMPQIEPSLDAHTKLMQALAAEHVRFLQRTPSSAASTPTPSFLAPYLKDLADQKSHRDSLAAFSTADTGPLPIIQPLKPRRISQMRHITIIGVAASILIALMIGGMTSLLMLASQNGGTVAQIKPNVSSGGLNVVPPAQINPASYTTEAFYPHVASAVASNDGYIYYTAYSDSGTDWMLERMPNDYKEEKKDSIPLLSSASTNPILVLGSTKEWLYWLQVDSPKAANTKTVHPLVENKLAGAWSLHALNLNKLADQQARTINTTQTPPSLTLHQDTFDQSVVPSWINSPIQGIQVMKDKLLVALVDGKGNSHLLSYQLAENKVLQTTEFDNKNNGHIITSPTMNTDGTIMFWSDEWVQNGHLNSNIWTRQVVEAQPNQQGRWAAHNEVKTYLYRDDGSSFRPQLVNDTLFLMSRLPNTKDNQANLDKTPQPPFTATANPSVTAQAQASATAAIATPTKGDVATLLGGTTTIDPTIRIPQINETIVGKILTFNANGATPIATPFDDRPAMAMQSSGQFLIWRNAISKNFEMYDVAARSPVIIGQNDIPKDAAFMKVNEGTVVWAKYIGINTDPNTITSTTVSIGTFKWANAKSSSGN